MSQQVYLLTYRDLIDDLVDYMGGASVAAESRAIRRAIQEALRRVCEDRRWSYLYKEGRVNTVAPQTTGTLTYTHSTRTITLSGATWPSWAIYGRVRVGAVIAQISSVTSSTVAIADPVVNFGEDLDAGSSYTLFRSNYTLPIDFIKLSDIMQESSWWDSTYVHPEQLLALERYGVGTGTPQAWTICGDPNLYGSMSLGFYPAPDSVQTLDFVYYRRPRPLRYSGYETKSHQGTVSTTADSATLSGGSGSNVTAFESGMAGAVVRVSANTTPPTGLDGTNPYAEERILTSYSSATSFTVDTAFSQTLSNVAYTISDPVDVDQVMLTPLRAAAEMFVAQFQKDSDYPGAMVRYMDALRRSGAADNRVISEQRAGGGRHNRFRRIAYMPAGTDDG